MKKESNAGLFFVLAVGIVGLGLYYGAAEDYSAGEFQLYHIVCWVILIVALLRVLELIWGPIRSLWDQAWGRMPEKKDDFRTPRPDRREQYVPHREKEHEEEPKPAYEEEKIDRPDGVIIMPDRGARFYLDDKNRDSKKKSDKSGIEPVKKKKKQEE